jgi:hypothetical protein
MLLPPLLLLLLLLLLFQMLATSELTLGMLPLVLEAQCCCKPTPSPNTDAAYCKH